MSLNTCNKYNLTRKYIVHMNTDYIREGTHLSSKLLQTSNVDGTLLRGVEIAPTHTEVRGRAHHSAGKAQRVVREDVLTGPIVVLGEGEEGGG